MYRNEIQFPKRHLIYVLNNIDTPFHLEHRQYFLDVLPTIIYLIPSERFVLNTNTVDGPYLFSLTELVKMRMLLNSSFGEAWKPQSWMKKFVPETSSQSKKKKITVMKQTLNKINNIEREICRFFIENGDAFSTNRR